MPCWRKLDLRHHPMHGVAFTGKNQDSAIWLIEQAGKLHLVRRASHGPPRGETENTLRSGIDEPQAMLRIEGQHRRVHGINDATQQRAGLKLIQALALQQVSEFVDLKGKLSQRIELPAAAGTKRVIRLAQRGDHVGQRLQRTDDLLHEHARCDQ